MNKGFWNKLKKPIMVLAPMANVTDAAFRKIIAANGKPDVTWTEFVSVDGLLSAGKEKLLVDFWYSDEQRPIVAQIFGAKPKNFAKVAKMIEELGFDGIDINMGCPDRGVERQNAGAALIKNPKLAQEIIAAVQQATNLPVSVKTRIGFNKVEIESWLSALTEMNLAAITVHLRTRKEMSKVAAHWELMPKIVEVIKSKNPETLVLGNGDVTTISEAEEKCKEYGCDGVMIGRGIFGNPWLFNRQVSPASIGVAERLSVMLEHTFLFEKMFAGIKNFEVMKKHYKAYVNGFDGAKELRTKLMEAENSKEVEQLVQAFLVKEKTLA